MNKTFLTHFFSVRRRSHEDITTINLRVVKTIGQRLIIFNRRRPFAASFTRIRASWDG
ncbi:hypothetical protein KIF59_14160 [Enterobacter cloacae subsp. cloacae]|nr:hypothetical protein [Enterobacter cloacae subsp. cloacae]